MITIPETILFGVLTSALQVIVEDFNNNDEEDTLLYKLFYGVKLGESYDYYEQAKSLILKDIGDPSKLEVRMFFDLSRAQMPTFHITLPSENVGGDNGIGFDPNVEFNEDGTQYTYNYHRSFITTYQIICTSQNSFEVQILYNLCKSILLSFLHSFELNGLQNMKISGGDLSIADLDWEKFPFYGRTLSVEIIYNFEAPNFFLKDSISSLFLDKLKIILPAYLSPSGEKEVYQKNETIKIE